MITEEQFRRTIGGRFRGVLTKGAHLPDSTACALEAYAVAIGHAWTDSPEQLSMPDLRPLNDGPWSSDAARTEAMIPLVAALSRWWQRKRPEEQRWHRSGRRRRSWCERVALRTVREIIAELPGLSSEIAQQCRVAMTLPQAAAAAAEASDAAAAWAPARAAGASVALAMWAPEAAVRAEASAAGVAKEVAGVAAWAARAAKQAAEAGGTTGADAVLRRACRIWIEETEVEGAR